MLTSLYIHIPFCKHICTYCDFHKEIASLEKKEKYLKALRTEIEQEKDHFKDLKTIYIGGGTPSNLSLSQLEQLLQKLSSVIEINTIDEYTIEVNPDDLTREMALLLKKYGINRVSMGVQTFDEKLLLFLRRTHNKQHVEEAISILKDVGIENISIDMIFNIPNQTMDILYNDINTVTSLPVTHISYYSLILEEKSILYQLVKKNKVHIEDQDQEGDMYVVVMDELIKRGFIQYEISNFTKPGFNSIHNTTYWTNKEYMGLGSGSHGMMNNKRYYNVSNVSKYSEHVLHKKPYKEEYEYNYIEDHLMMGLRLLQGVHITTINELYNINVYDKYPELKQHISNNLLEEKNGYLRFTRKGLLLGNIVFSSILEG